MEEQTKKGITKVTIIVILLGFLILVPTTIYFYLNFNKNKSKPVKENLAASEQRQKEILSEDNVLLSKFSRSSTKENAKEYLNNVNTELSSEEISQRTKDFLLLRKALVLSANRYDDRSVNTKEATDILVDLINRNQATDTISTYIRSFSTISLVRTQNLCCDNANSENYLFKLKIAGYDSKYDEYIAMGYSKGLSKLLALNDLIDTISSTYENDSVNKKNSLHNKTRILSIYNKEISEEIRAKLIIGLKKDLDEVNKDIPMTFVDTGSLYDVKYAYVFGFDVYNQVTNNLTNNINKQIDIRYEQIDSFTPDMSNLEIDPISLNEVKYYNAMTYLKSLNDRYGKNVDKEKFDKIVERILTLINSSKELKNVAYTNFHTAEFKNGEYANHSFFASQRVNNEKIDDYLKSIGI